MFGPAQQQEPRSAKRVARLAPPVPVAPEVNEADLEELKRQVQRALRYDRLDFCRRKTKQILCADLCRLKQRRRSPEAGPLSPRAAPPPAKKAKLGAPLAELLGENQAGRCRVSSHGTAYLDDLLQEGSTGGSKGRVATPDLVLSSDSEGGDVEECRTIRGMIVLDSDEE